MALNGKESYAVTKKRIPVGAAAVRPPNAEPLRCNRVPVLQPAVADVARGDVCMARQLSRQPLCIGRGLFDMQEVVFAGAGCIEAEILPDDELLGTATKLRFE